MKKRDVITYPLIVMTMIFALKIGVLPVVDVNTLPLNAMTKTSVPLILVLLILVVFTLKSIAKMTMLAPITTASVTLDVPLPLLIVMIITLVRMMNAIHLTDVVTPR
jgi:hypothetical protein